MKTSYLALAALSLASLATACAPSVTVDQGLGQSNQTVLQGGGICGDVELHVVGVYDPYSAATNVQGPASVHIDRPGSVVLFLSSYSAADWTVTTGPETDLVAVYTHGYEAQTVQAPDGVETTVLSFESGADFLGCGYEFPDQDPTSGCETPELLAGIEGLLDLPVTSFHGCYAASDFTIGADLSSSSNCAVDMGYSHTSFVSAGCTDEPTDPGSCAGKDGPGHYEGFFCDPGLIQNFIITEGISCEEALGNCQINAAANPELSIYCTWNGEDLYMVEQQSGVCGP
jgi:hypothetical protein